MKTCCFIGHRKIVYTDKLYKNVVRAEYEFIDTDYENYLLQSFERTYFAENAYHAGKLVYIKRNQEMIDKSDTCVFYFDKFGNQKANGTRTAFDYAVKKQKIIFNVLSNE